MNAAEPPPVTPTRSVAIITVTYNSEDEIEAFVESVRRQAVPTVLWLVDNASGDGTPAILERLSHKFDWIRVILNSQNVGLAAGNNRPLPYLAETYTVIANPDGLMKDGMLLTLIERLESSPDVVAAAPVNVDADGQPHSSFFRNWTLLHLFVWRMLPASAARLLYRLVRSYDNQDVLFASGACLMTRTRDFVRIGGYDENYFLTVEDACDLCIRLRRPDANRVVLESKARFVHYISRSAAAVPFVTVWNAAKGSVYHFRKHNGLLAGIGAYAIVQSATLGRLVLSLPLAAVSARARARVKNNWRVAMGLVKENPLRMQFSR